VADRRMFRYTVPVDDKAHEFALTSDPVAVAAPQVEVVEFWAEHDEDEGAGAPRRVFQVFGTGHPLPEGAVWVGTCPRIHGLVWHLYELTGPAFTRFLRELVGRAQPSSPDREDSR
jgi:hypothetical protein